MSRTLASVAALAALAAAVSMMAACGSKAPKELRDGTEIVASRCARCHDTGRIASANYDRDGWTEVVSRMIGRGADLTDNEAMLLIDFLTSGGGKSL